MEKDPIEIAKRKSLRSVRPKNSHHPASICLEGAMSDKKFTVSCKIAQHDGVSFLKDYARIFGKSERDFFVDYFIKEKPLNKLKTSYQVGHGIMARQFNSISYSVKGKWAARKTQYERQIESIESSIAAVKKTIDKNNKEIDKIRTQIDKIERYQKAVQLRNSTGKGRKPRLTN